VFLKKGAKEALKFLDRPDLTKALLEATIAQLSQALTEAIAKIQYNDVQDLQKNPTSETNQALLEVQDTLDTFLTSLNRNE
jgi:hypothetical protein